jgi:hypothetical protein
MNLVFQINCFYKPLIGLQLHHLIGISFASNGSHNLGFDCLRGIVIQFLLLGFEWLPMIWVRMPAKVNSSVETSCLSREGFVTIDSAEKMLLLLVALWPVSSRTPRVHVNPGPLIQKSQHTRGVRVRRAYMLTRAH